jgi:signal transduction histidine kinase/CheY-like chemotaxis protein
MVDRLARWRAIMWDSVVWWRHLHDAPIARQVEDLRRDTLRLFLTVATLGYAVWHFARTHAPGTSGLDHWPLLPLALATLVGAGALHGRHPRLAAWWFLLGATLTLAGAAWLLGTATPLALVPLLVLAAVVLLHPLAGALVGALGLALLAAPRAADPLHALADERVQEAAVVCLLAIVVAWALGRTMAQAVQWSATSAADAWARTQEARQNRAELVQALRQLDHAYTSLRRANAALELAWKAADAAERSKSEFVTNISHELRTPLNLIIGFSEMILTTPETYGQPLPAAYRGDLNAIFRSAQHLLTLTNDVIDLARVGMGRLALVREPVDVAQVIEDASGLIREYVAAKGLWLRLEVAPDTPLLHIDRLRVRQVLLNLLTNAARFTERGGITVGVAVEAGQARVTVADTGRGIAPADLEKVFREFYSTGEDSTHLTRELGGVGLGLPLSRRFIELHGGQMGVESTPRVGSRFWFTLPVVAVDGLARGEHDRFDPRGLASADERIVVLAGAERTAQEFLQRHLHGYRVLAADDLPAAAAMAEEARAVAILTDRPGPLDLPLPVAVVRLPLPRPEQVVVAAGATTYLTKPIARATLYEAIAALPDPIDSILLVDDDPRFLRLVARMLQAAPRPPRRVDQAGSGQQALDRLATLRPDLILLDQVMPDLDGTATLAALRADPSLAAIPVIVISAQDRLKAQFPLRGDLTLHSPDGLGMDALLGALGALLATLRPPLPTGSRQ